MPPVHITSSDDEQPAVQAKERFVWPPRPVVVDLHTPDQPEPARPPPAPRPQVQTRTSGPGISRDSPVPFSWLHEIERTWMGMTRGPWRARAAAEGWAPDEPFIYCPRCATTIGAHELTEKNGVPVCQACRDKKLPWGRAVRLGEYDGLLRDAIHEVKFTRWRALGAELGRALGLQVGRALDEAGVDRAKVVLVPVPTTFRRRLQRGIDHTLVLARAARQVLGCDLVLALARRHRPSQLEVPPSERQANVAGTFRLRRGLSLGGRIPVLVDDVRTTGATLTAACRAILSGHRATRPSPSRPPRPGLQAGDLWTAVLGVTPDPARPGGAARTGGPA